MKKLILTLSIIAGVLWGSVGIFVRELSAFGVDSYTVLSSRMLLATLILFIGILVVDTSLLKIKLKDFWIFLASGLLGMLGLNFCYNESINQLTLSLAAVLLSISPIFVMFWGAILFKERITMRKTTCMSLAILGCLFTSGVLESTVSMKWSVVGIFIGVLSAFFYALYSVFSKIAMDKGYQVFTITFYSLLTVTIVLLPLTDWNMLGEFVRVEPIGHSIFLVLHSLCTSILPYVFYTVALIYVETGKASILAAGGEPIAAMIFGVLIFSEIPTFLTLLGLVLTITALSMLCIPAKQKEVSIAEK